MMRGLRTKKKLGRIKYIEVSTVVRRKRVIQFTFRLSWFCLVCEGDTGFCVEHWYTGWIGLEAGSLCYIIERNQLDKRSVKNTKVEVKSVSISSRSIYERWLILCILRSS
jgi:hypothetical protein